MPQLDPEASAIPKVTHALRLPRIDSSRCTGCGWCVAACPEHVLSLQVQGWRKTSLLHDEGRCTGCRRCERRCPFHVIEMLAPEPPREMGDNAGHLQT